MRDYSNIFVSQRDRGVHERSGCGIASLLMLMKFIKYNPLPSWNELCTSLHVANGLQSENLYSYVAEHHVEFRSYFSDSEWEAALVYAPIMVLLYGILDEFPKDSHWVVLTQFNNGYFSYMDPWDKEYNKDGHSISFEKFKKIYTGFACQLIGVRHEISI